MRYLYLIALLSTVHAYIFGTIVKNESIESIKNYVPKGACGKDILVVLDLDNTVAMSILEPTFTPWFNKVLVPGKNQPTLSLKERFNYIVQLKPMESTTVSFLKELQAQQIPVIILTARTANLHLRTYAQLNKIGLDFSTSLPVQNQTIIPENMKPVPFHNGILLCSDQDKGTVLRTFIEQNQLAPKKIVFVDDMIENIFSVDQAMQTAAIDCTAIYYTRKKQYGLGKKIGYSFKALFGMKV